MENYDSQCPSRQRLRLAAAGANWPPAPPPFRALAQGPPRAQAQEPSGAPPALYKATQSAPAAHLTDSRLRQSAASAAEANRKARRSGECGCAGHVGSAPPISAARRGVAPAPAKYERDGPGGTGPGSGGGCAGRAGLGSAAAVRPPPPAAPAAATGRAELGVRYGPAGARGVSGGGWAAGCAGPARGNKGGAGAAAAPRDWARARPAASLAESRSGLGGEGSEIAPRSSRAAGTDTLRAPARPWALPGTGDSHGCSGHRCHGLPPSQPPNSPSRLAGCSPSLLGTLWLPGPAGSGLLWLGGVGGAPLPSLSGPGGALGLLANNHGC
ncbi:collagen alpha-2(I) chain-like [Poecile atricapillus]|uniref:collagen alpha-2(I) chain-like n=1 Tax=Poecile atricapillus TaxID=48891 RepID=UPI0027383861|nr:collagen alpha-2(I) chain-like [Poecile atricapillus]